MAGPWLLERAGGLELVANFKDRAHVGGWNKTTGARALGSDRRGPPDRPLTLGPAAASPSFRALVSKCQTSGAVRGRFFSAEAKTLRQLLQSCLGHSSSLGVRGVYSGRKKQRNEKKAA
ncbi:hypothetical protein NDU88_004376 [Pleurodeles waltl]|uniref:Uncharacterized protein n=1 Tax=Pleurodeles waltl TaxID=8319 RepID=A0AAV7T8L4_PLEWA|nr:hypothetical protein NDU88_004376 [Pleurodeles waltl]